MPDDSLLRTHSTIVWPNTLVVPTGLPGTGGWGGMTVGPEAPNDPAIGWYWFNENTGELRIWDGTRWLSIAVSRPAMWDSGESRWDIQAIWDEGRDIWDDGTSLWDDGAGEAIWDAGLGFGGGGGLSLEEAVALFVQKAGDTMLGPLDMGEFPINNLAPVPNPPNGAAPRYWVLQEIAATSLYQGIWNVQHNVPDLSQASLHQNDFGWIAITPTPDTAVIVPNEPPMPGLNGETVHYGDHIIWSSVEGRFDIIQSSNLSLTEAEDLFLLLDGGTMRGPLLVDRVPTTDMQVANRRWVLDQIEEGGGGGGTPFPEAPLDGRGYLRIGQPPARWDAGLSLLGGIMLGPINMNGLAIVNLPADPPATSNNAAPAYWVMQEISATTLYQGTWQALLNIPDLSRVETHHNGFSWIALTPDPTQSIRTTATGIAGIPQNTEIWYGDHIVWSESYSRFDVIRSSNLSLLEAEEFFVLKAGDTMEGPLYLEELPANPSPLLAARVDWVLQRIAEVEAGGGIELPLTIAHGGTEATNAPQARINLGITQENLGGPFLQLAGGTMEGPINMGQFAITNLALIPEDEDWAVSRHWLNETVAATTLYQGVWQADLNFPDLTQVSTHQNGFSWIALTPDPNQSVMVPAGILGPDAIEVFYADHIVWSSYEGRFDVIHSGNLSVTEAEQLFLSLTGGTMKGPINMTYLTNSYRITGLPDPVNGSDAATMSWVLTEIANAEIGGGEPGGGPFLPLAGGTLSDPGNLVVGGNLHVGGLSGAFITRGRALFATDAQNFSWIGAAGGNDQTGIALGWHTDGAANINIIEIGRQTNDATNIWHWGSSTLYKPGADYNNPLATLRAQEMPTIQLRPIRNTPVQTPSNDAEAWNIYATRSWFGLEALSSTTPDTETFWMGFNNSQPRPWMGIAGGIGNYGTNYGYSVQMEMRGLLQVTQAANSFDFGNKVIELTTAGNRWNMIYHAISGQWGWLAGVKPDGGYTINEAYPGWAEWFRINPGNGQVTLGGPLWMTNRIDCGDIQIRNYTGQTGNVLAAGWIHSETSLGTNGNIYADGNIFATGGVQFGAAPNTSFQFIWDGLFNSMDVIVNAPSQGIWNDRRVVTMGWSASQYFPVTNIGTWVGSWPYELNVRYVRGDGYQEFGNIAFIRVWAAMAPLPPDALAVVNSIPDLQEDLVRPVIPDAVIPGHDETPDHMYEPPLIKTLWKAVQQLSARVDELERAR